MVCRTFEGYLYRKSWMGTRKSWVRLHRGTILIYDKQSDLDTDRSETNFTKKSGHHVHLDLAIVKEGKKPNSIKIRLCNGASLKFKVPLDLRASFRGEWIQALKSHIAYANNCIGVKTAASTGVSDADFLEGLAKEAKERLETLHRSLFTLHNALRDVQPRIEEAGVGHSVQDVVGASERAQKSLREFHDAVLQENRKREEELILERDRAQLAEDALEVVSKKYSALLSKMDRQSGLSSVASSAYFTPNGSMHRSVSNDRSLASGSSEYFTPEGSLHAYGEAFHDVANEGDSIGPAEGLAFPKNGYTLISARTRVSEDVERILSELDEDMKRRNGSCNVPRVASFGPMSVAGSSYNDLRSRSSSRRSDRDQFEDCISVDTRSFILSDSGASPPPPPEEYLSDTQTKSNYTDAKSTFSETQSFKSAISTGHSDIANQIRKETSVRIAAVAPPTSKPGSLRSLEVPSVKSAVSHDSIASDPVLRPPTFRDRSSSNSRTRPSSSLSATSTSPTSVTKPLTPPLNRTEDRNGHTLQDGVNSRPPLRVGEFSMPPETVNNGEVPKPVHNRSPILEGIRARPSPRLTRRPAPTPPPRRSPKFSS
ncbi:hypothetical protein RvY_13383 [Ramazzottius varieornatus]|uniref:PH domain-containing protein n=1 Tax=Ramazzottius varieornatus TaxID=947166 RepID=A0A1D1VPJ2_RAMVA|nr:hypothetical protein RvY_13383 [Ramazzottius varieornatus]